MAHSKHIRPDQRDARDLDGPVNAVEITAQLKRILASSDFEQSRRLCKFLTFIVEETIAGRADYLKEYMIGVDVFERGESFDPQTSSVVRVEAGRLRSRLEKYNAVDGRDDPIHITLPPGAYVPAFRNNSVDPALTRDKMAEPWRGWNPTPFSKSVVAISSMLIVVVGVVALQLFSARPEGGPFAQSNSIAILPLRNLSGDLSQDYFSDGITDALITALAQQSRMRVISTRSVLSYKHVEKPIVAIANELNVSHVVEGAVMRIGDNVRITAQLIEVKNNRHLWAETFEREITDALQLQQNIVQRIVASLVSKVAAEEIPEPADSPRLTQAAYETQLKGRFFQSKMTEDGLKKGLGFFKEAVKHEPNYSLAYSGMAACYCILGGHGFELVKPSEAMPVAKKSALEALALNGSLAEPHAFLGIIHLKYEWDWKAAESAFRQSIALNPSYVQARLFYSYLHEAMGRKSEAIREAKLARDIDPLSLTVNINLGWQHLQDDRLEEARRHFENTAELNPDFWGVHWGLGHYHRRKNNYDDAIKAFQKAVNSGGGHALPLNALGYTYAIAGKPGKALETVAELEQLSKQGYVSPVNTAVIYAGMGEKDKAFAWLEKAYSDRSRSLAWLNVLPEFNGVRTDQRFKSLVQRIGLPE